MTTLCGLPGKCSTGTTHDPGEAVALSTLVDFLMASGSTVTVECSPDIRVDCPWTNDWMLLIDGTPWLIEHTSLTYSSHSIPRLGGVERELRDFLDQQGRSHSVRMSVIVSPSIDAPGGLSRNDARRHKVAAYDAIKQWLTGVLATMAPWEADEAARNYEDGLGTSVNIIRLDPNEDHEDLGYGFTGSSMAGNPNLREQFDANNAPVIRRKLAKQIRKRPGLVELTGLIVDQLDSEAGVPNRILSPEGVRQAMVSLLKDFPSGLDRLWMLRGDGSMVELDLSAPTPGDV